ncbi:BACON domain-containing protein [Butyricimonas sp.]|uniref:BACON domain-containing protein n=1 Tax=Butyricimonas sp. TaxID=1969738 RepID=UPI0025BCA713|nr:BACON domain-containing protein [Butyricimonas sp.]
MNRKLFLKNGGLLVAILIMFFAGCKDDENEVEPILGLGESSYQFTNSGGEYALAIFSNVNWTLTKEGDWFTLDAMSGSGNRVVKVEAKANEGGTREGTITVVADGMESQKITISQGAVEDAVLRELGKDAYELKPEGGIMKLSVETTVDYTLEMSDWVEAAGTYALTKSEITLHIEPNLWGEKRSCKVVLRAKETGEAVKTISLVQGSMAWDLPEDVELNKFGEERTIAGGVPEGWTWSIKDLFKGAEDEKWCHFTVTDDGLKIVADRNISMEEREVSVLVTLDKTGMSKMLTFKQAARQAIAIESDGWNTSGDVPVCSIDCIAFDQMIEILSDEPDGWEYTVTGKPDDWTVTSSTEGIRVVGTDRVESGSEVIQMEINITMKDKSSSLKLLLKQKPYHAPTLLVLNYLGGVESPEVIVAPEGGIQTRYVKFDLGDRIELVCESEMEAWTHISMINEHSISIQTDALEEGAESRKGVVTVNLMRGDKVVATTEMTVKQGAEEPYIRLIDTEESLKYRDGDKYNIPFQNLSFNIKVEANVDWEITNTGEKNTQYTCEKIDNSTIKVSLTTSRGPTMPDLVFDVHTKGQTNSDPLNKKIIIKGRN